MAGPHSGPTAQLGFATAPGPAACSLCHGRLSHAMTRTFRQNTPKSCMAEY